MNRPARFLLLDAAPPGASAAEAAGLFGAALDALPPGSLLVCLQEGLGGAWTDVPGGRELVRIGYPARSPHSFFRPIRAFPGNCAAVAVSRMLFGRRVTDAATIRPELESLLASACEGHDVRAWLPSVGETDWPGFARRCIPGAAK